MARQQGISQHTTQCAKTWKVLVITLNKTVQGLYTENYEKLPRELKKTKINIKAFCVYELEDFKYLDLQYYPN